MVATRRQSKNFDPIELPTATHRKRKRSNDTVPAQSAPQPLNQLSTKRRKKVKSTAKTGAPPVHPQPASTVSPVAPSANTGTKTASVKVPERKTPKQKTERKGTRSNGTREASDDDSSGDETTREPEPATSRGVDDDEEDADSRYALGSRRKGRPTKPAPPIVRRTAEFKFEEDGLEEIDKATAAVTFTNNRTTHADQRLGTSSGSSTHRTSAGAKTTDQSLEQNERWKTKRPTRIIPPLGVPLKLVMFTIAEAIEALNLYKDGTMSVPIEVDPQSRQPYKSLQTGEVPSYPVKGTYHLGALGRYGIEHIPPPPFSLTVPLSEHSFMQNTPPASAAESSRHGLGFEGALATRSKVPAVRRPNNYCFTFGRFRGRRIDSVPISYLRSIFNSDDYHNDTKLQQAFTDLYPKGLYESEAESYTFEKGGFKGKRLDEVPKSYLWGLLRKKDEGDLVGGKKGRGRLERALEVWEKGQLDLTQD